VVVVIPAVVDGKLDKRAKRRQSIRDGIKPFSWTSIKKKAGNQHILVISLTVLTCNHIYDVQQKTHHEQ
jgi:hypothetical protein